MANLPGLISTRYDSSDPLERLPYFSQRMNTHVPDSSSARRSGFGNGAGAKPSWAATPDTSSTTTTRRPMAASPSVAMQPLHFEPVRHLRGGEVRRPRLHLVAAREDDRHL